MPDIAPPSASPGSALTELQTDLAIALRTPNVAVDRELLAAYVEAAAPNSIRALRQDVEAFDLWCRRSDTRAFPATPGMVADWLKHRASEGAAPASLVRYKASIAKAHRLLGLDDPTKHEICRLAIAAHRRKVGSQQKQARPLRFRGAVKNPVQDTPRGIHIRAILAACDGTPTGLRNRALLSVAYDTGLRASELVTIALEDIVEALDPDARLLRIGRHKGDQDGEGSTAYLSPRSVGALDAWLRAADVSEGPVFRRVIVRRYAARPARRRIDPNTLSGRAIWDPRRFAAKAVVAARTEYHVGEKGVTSWLGDPARPRHDYCSYRCRRVRRSRQRTGEEIGRRIQCPFDAGRVEPRSVRDRRNARRDHGCAAVEVAKDAASIQPQSCCRSWRSRSATIEARLGRSASGVSQLTPAALRPIVLKKSAARFGQQ